MNEQTLEDLIEATSQGDLDPAYEQLGLSVPEIASFGREDIKEIVHAGLIWWRSKEEQARALVCNSDTVKRVGSDDLKEIAAVIFATLIPEFIHAQAIAIAVIISRTGVRQWCSSHWREGGGVSHD